MVKIPISGVDADGGIKAVSTIAAELESAMKKRDAGKMDEARAEMIFACGRWSVVAHALPRPTQDLGDPGAHPPCSWLCDKFGPSTTLLNSKERG